MNVRTATGGLQRRSGREEKGREHVGDADLLELKERQAEAENQDAAGGGGRGDHGFGDDRVERPGPERERALHEEHRSRREQNSPPKDRGEGECSYEIEQI